MSVQYNKNLKQIKIMESFNEVYTKNHKVVLNYVNYKINNFVIAEELTNDVFMRVHKHLDRYDSKKSAMSTWVMNIASNIVIDHYRKVKKETISLDSPMDENSNWSLMDTMKTSTNPQKRMIDGELSDRIQNEISSLPENYRKVSELFFNQQLNLNEISQQLNIPIGTVKGQISRARTKLTNKLQTVEI